MYSRTGPLHNSCCLEMRLTKAGKQSVPPYREENDEENDEKLTSSYCHIFFIILSHRCCLVWTKWSPPFSLPLIYFCSLSLPSHPTPHHHHLTPGSNPSDDVSSVRAGIWRLCNHHCLPSVWFSQDSVWGHDHLFVSRSIHSASITRRVSIFLWAVKRRISLFQPCFLGNSIFQYFSRFFFSPSNV